MLPILKQPQITHLCRPLEDNAKCKPFYFFVLNDINLACTIVLEFNLMEQFLHKEQILNCQTA